MYITYTFFHLAILLIHQIFRAFPLPVTISLAIKAVSLRFGSMLWLLPGNWLTGRGNSLAVLLEVLFTLALLEL